MVFSPLNIIITDMLVNWIDRARGIEMFTLTSLSSLMKMRKMVSERELGREVKERRRVGKGGRNKREKGRDVSTMMEITEGGRWPLDTCKLKNVE